MPRDEVNQETASNEPELPFRDLTHEVCPMTFVRAKLYLETMASGERIGFMLKEGTQVRYVPPNLEDEGHLIESTHKVGDTYRVVVRKDGKQTVDRRSERSAHGGD